MTDCVWDWLNWAMPAAAFVFGWLTRPLRDRVRIRRWRAAHIDRMLRLPPKAKALLREFHDARAQSLRGFIHTAEVQLLIAEGILRAVETGRWPDGDVHGYLTVHPDFWEVMDDWAACEPTIVGHEEIE